VAGDACRVNGVGLVGQNVRRFRQERQLSLGALAQAAGVAKQTLANLENGAGNPTIETLFAVSRALEIGVSWLLAEWGTPVHVQRAADADWSDDDCRRIRVLDRTFGSGQVNTVIMELLNGDSRPLPALANGAVHRGYVIRGDIIAGPVGQEVTLHEGDFVRFPSDVPYLLRAASGQATLHVVAMVPHALFSALFRARDRADGHGKHV
jgi:transcriptional regulator with XRE-family HTH domain